MTRRPYNLEDVLDYIKRFNLYVAEADDRGSVDHAIGNLQIYLREMEDVYDEYGGI